MSVTRRALTTHHPINGGKISRASVNIPFVLYFCIVTSIFIYYWRNTCETSASRGGRPWNRLWVCLQVPKCLHYFVNLEAGVGNSADIWGILYIHKENGDWPGVLKAYWENFQTAWLLGRVLLLPFPGGFLIPWLLAQRALLVLRGEDFLESPAL